jgi:hypothetical protein
MRIWSIHPKYLDTKGLTALWRETLLAQKVMQGKTKGYKNHPQLIRFKIQKDPLSFLNLYLLHLWKESQRRGYNFNQTKIGQIDSDFAKIKVTQGQINYEFSHLMRKLKKRDKQRFDRLNKKKVLDKIEIHPVFEVIEGDVEDWEKV